jgi:hypothetical protein
VVPIRTTANTTFLPARRPDLLALTQIILSSSRCMRILRDDGDREQAATTRIRHGGHPVGRITSGLRDIGGHANSSVSASTKRASPSRGRCERAAFSEPQHAHVRAHVVSGGGSIPPDGSVIVFSIGGWPVFGVIEFNRLVAVRHEHRVELQPRLERGYAGTTSSPARRSVSGRPYRLAPMARVLAPISTNPTSRFQPDPERRSPAV